MTQEKGSWGFILSENGKRLGLVYWVNGQMRGYVVIKANKAGRQIGWTGFGEPAKKTDKVPEKEFHGAGKDGLAAAVKWIEGINGAIESTEPPASSATHP